MSEGWEDRFHAILAEILRVKYHVEDVAEVTGFDEDSYYSGGCETCAYTVHELTVYWIDSTGTRRVFMVEGEMSDFMYEPTTE